MIKTPAYDVGAGVSGGESGGGSQSTENGSKNSVQFSYRWNTKLVADNQRAIGKAYWGPLGDIFLLLHNPWFAVIGDENGMSLAVDDSRTSQQTEILILPAHKLLRPEGDPIASRIPPETRKRILELDPFLMNLDDYFPVDLGKPLEHAANPFADPSTGTQGSYQGTNRAALMARYGISAGIELDLTAVTAVAIDDCRTNETVYSSQVEKSFGLDGSIGLLGGLFDLAGGSTTVNKSFVRVSYQTSNETRNVFIKTAKCFLIRNQNAARLWDIELWYDKQFSTFMFRLICPGAGRIFGTIAGLKNRAMGNALVELFAVELYKVDKKTERALPSLRRYATMTDHRGRFAINNIVLPGTYELRSGGVRKRIRVTSEDVHLGQSIEVIVKGAKRHIDLSRSAQWEISEELELSPRDASKLQAEFRKTKRIAKASFRALLKSHNLSLEKLERQVTFDYRKPRRKGAKHP
jgi:hypothetical protein